MYDASMNSAENVPGDVPSIEEVFGFDPNRFVGGTLEGWDTGLGTSAHMPVKDTVAKICFARGNNGQLMFQVFVDSDDDMPKYLLMRGLVSAQVYGNRLVLTMMPYAGIYMITAPERKEAATAEERIAKNIRFIANAEFMGS